MPNKSRQRKQRQTARAYEALAETGLDPIDIIEGRAEALRQAIIHLQDQIGEDTAGQMRTRSKAALAAWMACTPQDDDVVVDHDLEDCALATFLAVWWGAYGRREGEDTMTEKFHHLLNVVKFSMRMDGRGHPLEQPEGGGDGE